MKILSHLKKYKTGLVVMKYLNNTQKNKIQKVNDSGVELEKDIRELKDREKIGKTFRH